MPILNHLEIFDKLNDPQLIGAIFVYQIIYIFLPLIY